MNLPPPASFTARILRIAVPLAAALLCSACATTPAAPTATPAAASATTPWSDARQMVVVTSSGWDQVRGSLRRFEREGSRWRQLGEATPVMLGRAGSAWGLGLHDAQPDGPQKREGDGRNPAGVFDIGFAFGSPASVGTGLEYQQMQASHWCMDVPESPLYNRIVDSREVGDPAVEGSTEPMRLDLRSAGDDRYKLGFTIAHNPGNTPQMGSCIFAHLWGNPDKTTAGCTAMGEPAMRALLGWLRPDARPVFVLMTDAAYDARQTDWHLPARTLFR